MQDDFQDLSTEKGVDASLLFGQALQEEIDE